MDLWGSGEVPTGTPRKSAGPPRGARNFDEVEPGVRQKPKVLVHLAVKKNRDGPTGGLPFSYEKQFCRITDPSNYAPPQQPSFPLEGV